MIIIKHNMRLTTKQKQTLWELAHKVAPTATHKTLKSLFKRKLIKMKHNQFDSELALTDLAVSYLTYIMAR